MFALVAGAALVAQQGGAQAPAPAPPAPPTASPQPAAVGPDGVQRPTFRAQIDYVEVSAIVTDDDGNLVKDLTKADFQILENGKPQTVAVFTPVQIPFERPERTLIEGRPLKFDVANNEGARDGRVYVIVLDDYHIGSLRTARVKIAVKEFIEKHVAANDQVAVIHASGRSNASQEFTTNKDLMLAAVDKLMGMKLRSATLEKLDDYRTRVEQLNACGVHGRARTGQGHARSGARLPGPFGDGDPPQPVASARNREWQPQGGAVLQRGHRLRRDRHHGRDQRLALRERRALRHARRHRRSHPQQRRVLHHRSPRPGRDIRRRDGHAGAAAGRHARTESLEHPRRAAQWRR